MSKRLHHSFVDNSIQSRRFGKQCIFLDMLDEVLTYHHALLSTKNVLPMLGNLAALVRLFERCGELLFLLVAEIETVILAMIAILPTSFDAVFKVSAVRGVELYEI